VRPINLSAPSPAARSIQSQRRLPWHAAGWFAVTAALLAQQSGDEMRARSSPYVPPAQASTILAQVNLVEVPVVVRDSGNRAVGGLQRSDFEVLDAGKPKEIASFSVEAVKGPVEPAASPAPADKTGPPVPAAAAAEPPQRLMVLMFDDLNTEFAELQRSKTAAERFVKDGLMPGDRVALATTAWQRTLVFSADRAELIQKIEALTTHSRLTDDSSAVLACPNLNAYEAYLVSNCMDPELVAVKAQELADCTSGSGGAARSGRGGGGASAACNGPVVGIARRFWEQARVNSDFSLRAVRAVVDALGKLPGRRSVLLTSAGFLSGELEGDMTELIHRALYAGVVINALEARGLYAYAPGVDSSQDPHLYTGSQRAVQQMNTELRLQGRRYDAPDDVLASLALGTGGSFFHNSNDLEAGYRQLGSVPDVVYVLGISLSDVAQDGKYHALKVRLAEGRRGSVQARPGYLAPRPAPPAAAPEPERAVDREFLAGDTLNDVPVTITPARQDSAGSAGSRFSLVSTVGVVAHVDLGRLNLEIRDGRHRQSLTLIAGLLDGNGTFLTGKQGQLDLALKEDTYQKMVSQGFNMSLSLDAPPGRYILRGVVQEGLTGKMTALNQALEIR